MESVSIYRTESLDTIVKILTGATIGVTRMVLTIEVRLSVWNVMRRTGVTHRVAANVGISRLRTRLGRREGVSSAAVRIQITANRES